MDRGCMGKSSFVMEGGATKGGVSTGRGMDNDECMDSFPCGTQQIQKIIYIAALDFSGASGRCEDGI